MSTDGTYGFVYCGAVGLGVGVFTVRSGDVVGRDYSGLVYQGTAKDQPDGRIELSITMTIPPGIPLAEGTSHRDPSQRREVIHCYPPLFGDGKPLEVSMGPGPITVMIKRIPDSFAPAAASGVSAEIAAKLAFAQPDYSQAPQSGSFILGPSDEPGPFILHE